MSSTLSRPLPAGTTASPAVPRAADAPEPAPPDEATGFARAVGLGVLVGLPAMMAVIALILRLAAPDMEPGAIFGTALWVALWGGGFLGGTVTVGLWAARQHR